MLKEKLMNDFKIAMKEKNIVKKNTIQLVRAAILNKEKDLQKELDDNECEQVIVNQMKQRKDALKIYSEKNLSDKINETQNEIDILQEYLPQPMTEQEVIEIIEKKIQELNVSDMKGMGIVIKAVKEVVGSRAEGKLISDIVKRTLK